MDAFLTDHPDNPSAQIFVERMKEEIAYYQNNKDTFGYIFYIGRKA